MCRYSWSKLYDEFDICTSRQVLLVRIYLYNNGTYFLYFSHMFRRIILFVITNIAIIIVGTIILSLIEALFGFKIRETLNTNYLSLAIFALFYGFFASFMSLFLSRWMAKKAHNIQLISEESLGTISARERLVYQTVASIASR